MNCGLMFLAVALCCSPLVAQVSNSEIVEDVKSAEPWTKAPAGFRDVPFGASVAAATAILGPLKCTSVLASESAPAHQSCATKDRSKAFKVNNQPVYTHYDFESDRFVGVSITGYVAEGWGANYVGPRPGDALFEPFKAKFGEPTRKVVTRFWGTEQVTIERTVRGRSAGNRIDFVPYDRKATVYYWTNEDVHIVLYPHAGVGLETAAWHAAKEKAKTEFKKHVPVSDF